MRVRFRCDPALLDRLPPPAPARQVLPDWLRSMPSSAFSQTHGQPVRTVKQCPPFVDAMSHGFVIRLPCDVEVRDGRLSWDWDLPPLSVDAHPRSPLSFHVPAQVSGTPFHRDDTVIVKFNSFWTIELDEGYSLFATHPINRFDLPFRLLTGIVDADRFSDVGILFPAVWTDPAFEGILEQGTPVAHCFPISREPIELDVAAFATSDVERYEATADKLLSETGLYRKRYRAKRGLAGEERASQSLKVEP